MKKLFSLMSFAVCAAGFAQSPTEMAQTPKPKAGEPTKKSLRNAIPLFEEYDNQGINLGVRGDILYMNYSCPVLAYASVRPEVTPTTVNQILPVTGTMSLGCNIAVNYTLPNDPGYTFESSWYHIVAQFKDSVSNGNIQPSHIVGFNTAQPGSASVNSHIAFNLFDLMVQKKFAFGDWVSMMPGAGLVGGYMDSVSRMNSSATSGSYVTQTPPVTVNQASLDQTIKYEAIGLKLGGKSTFKIWKELKLMADLYYSVMYGFSKAQLLSSANAGYTASAGATGGFQTYNTHFGRAFFDSLLGLSWSSHFCKDTLFLDLHAGWRFQSFSDGWREFEAETNDAIHTLALYGQGLQAGATFKF